MAKFRKNAVTLPEKAKAVNELFEGLDRSISVFQAGSGLSCKFGCGQCCLKPDIEATVLEFLPFALDAYRSGKAEEWLERAQAAGTVCVILDPGQSGAGLCSSYSTRGLICRLFGYSARLNKRGERELVTCSIIKSEQSTAYQTAAAAVKGMTLDIPVMSEYYMRLYSIDPDLSRDRLPINTALVKSLELVMHYFSYHALE
jgi:Fe-S-cluster containining protein